MAQIKLEFGDITKSKDDAIVNAANEDLYAGGGVCGAIFAAAGYDELSKACDEIGYCPTGKAVITKGFKLPAKYIIHAVGPVYFNDDVSTPLLKSAYQSSLEVASSHQLHSISFPAISAGIYGYPFKKAAKVALSAVKEYLDNHPNTSIEVVTFYFIDNDLLQIFEETLQAIKQ